MASVATARIESERYIGCIQIVVDRFRNADDTQAPIAQISCDGKAAVPPYHDQDLNAVPLGNSDSLIRKVAVYDLSVLSHRNTERVIFVTSSKNRPATREDAACI